MRRPRCQDLQCPSCGRVEERLVETNDDDTPLEPQLCANPTLFPADDEQPTGYCRAVLQKLDCTDIGFMKTITKGNHDFNDRERERLEQRQNEHWKRTGRDEAIDRERAYMKKHGAR